MSDLGYPSTVSHFNKLLEWIELHHWCLFTLTCALVQLEGGVDAVVGTNKVLVVYVNPAHRTAHGGNPAMAFQLAQAALIERDKEDFLRENWAYIRANADLCGFSAAIALLDPGALLPERSDEVASPVGTLPVVYVVRRTNMVSGQAFPLFSLPLRHRASEDVADARTRAAFEDLAKMMKGLLCDSDIVLRRAENPGEPQPDWGFLERTGKRGKTWKWRGIPADDQEERRKQERVLRRLMTGSTSGLTPFQVLTLFDYGRMGTKWWYVSSSILRCQP